MTRLIAWYKKNAYGDHGTRIPPLDGIRVLCILLVAFFHVAYQQAWLMDIRIGSRVINVYPIFRTGYLWVDMTLLLSAFLLYLPYVEAQQKNKLNPPLWPFYKARIARVVPSVYLCVLVMLLFVALPEKAYPDTGDMAKDILAHLSFTFNWFPKTHLRTPLNGALWTLAVEMQFYLIFPFLARSFRRRPLFTYGLMAGTAWAFRLYALSLPSPQMFFNQMPAFLDVYANGFVAAVVYKELKAKADESPWIRNLLLFSLLAAVAALYSLVLRQAQPTDHTLIQQGQMRIRFMQSVYSAVVLIAVSLGPGLIRVIFGNKLTYYLSSVSMQFYIYHQVLAVRLKKWGIPASIYPNPNQAGDRVWQRSYTALSLLLALLFAIALTYLFERPISKRLRKN